MEPVSRMILFMFSKWRLVMKLWSPQTCRAGTARVITMAKPEKIAPATK